jgi:hypothetical protein
MARIVAPALMALAVASCSNSTSSTAFHDAGQDASEVLPVIDAGCGNGNPGIGECKSVADCPPADACWAWKCALGPDQKYHCEGTQKDGGT